jgi:hypothetical protein
LNYIFKISTINLLTLALSLLFSIALISLPTFNLIEQISNQELYIDYENEKSNQEIDNENELDEFINDSLFTTSAQSPIKNFSIGSKKIYKILYLDIDSPPPKMI